MNGKGFLIIEVLMVMMILAVSFTAFMGAIGQVLKISSRSAHLTEAVSKSEGLLFELSSGLRPDLADYGGRGNLGEDFRYHIEETAPSEFNSQLKGRFAWRNGKESLEFEVAVLRASVQ